MNSPVSELRIDPEFESKVPPLTDDEYRQLEENILSEGAVLMPLIVLERHHRGRPYQLGLRNLTPIQKKLLIDDWYEAERMAHGATNGFRGNQHTEVVSVQNEHLPESGSIRKRIARETNTSPSYVMRAGEYSRGATAAEEVSPGFRQEVLSGKIKPTQQEMQKIARAEPEERRSIMDQIFCPATVKADRESAALVRKISANMVKEKPGMTPQKAIKQFEWKVTRVLQDFDDTFDQWPQLISDRDCREQVIATLQDLKNYISQIEGGKRYEWDHDARKIV